MARSPVGLGRGRLGARRPIDEDGSHHDEWAAIDAGLGVVAPRGGAE
jgi:hypothetical protein